MRIGFLLAELRMHKPFWFVNLLVHGTCLG